MGTKSSVCTSGKVPKRLGLAIITLTCIVTISLALFFWHIRISIRPSRWPPVDVEKKDDERGHGLDLWELVVCCLVPAVVWRFRIQVFGALHAATIHRRRTAAYTAVALFLVATVWALVIHRLVFPLPCRGWIRTDVGFIQGHEGMGHNMHTICQNNVWEPHVANAISDYLYGQGRAMDVGAFIGYHTLRLAKLAAPFDVYAFEGGKNDDLLRNVRRNNAKNVKVLQEKIDEKWSLGPTLEKELLDDKAGPVALVKIDCEGCEMNFIRGARLVFEKWHPVIVIEIQDDESRRNARVGGQQLVLPTETRDDVLYYLRNDLGYTVTPLLDKDGIPTWDYLALWLQS